MFRNALILLALLSQVAADDQVATATGNIRGFSPEQSEQNRRELWGSSWNFNSLLFHLHICKIAPDCPDHVSKGPLDCKCPDCTKEHLHPDVQTYCSNLSMTSVEASESSGSSGESSGSTEESDNSAKASGGETQSSSSKFSPLLAIIAAATVFALVGALLMRKRKNETEGARDLTGGSNAVVNDGLSMYFGAIMGKMGMGVDKTIPEGDEDLAGSVSRRMELLKEGGNVPPINAPSNAPAFIEINTFDGIQTTISECDQGIEIEGPSRPSSYAI